MTTTISIPLRGAGGEPVDLWRTIQSHGLNELPPMLIDDAARTIEVTVPLRRSRPRTILIAPGRNGAARVDVLGRAPSDGTRKAVAEVVRHLLRLDDDMSEFYAVARADPDLAWAAAGAGRMLRGATVFEDVVKTICTTNCSWALTTKMVSALVENLGEPAPGAPPAGPRGRAFPTPDAMAAAGERFYVDVARAGYRSRYLLELARGVAGGEVDLEEWGRAPRSELPDDVLEERLLMLPGVGPYAAAHIMMLLGRHSRLILDSWTRPKFARLTGKRAVSDAAILRRFKRYGPYAGIAFWLFLTRDWVAEGAKEKT